MHKSRKPCPHTASHERERERGGGGGGWGSAMTLALTWRLIAMGFSVWMAGSITLCAEERSTGEVKREWKI